MPPKFAFALTLALAVSSAWPLPTAKDLPLQDQKAKDLPKGCPASGATVPLAKAVSTSFSDDFKECDIVVEATFYKMGNEGYKLGR